MTVGALGMRVKLQKNVNRKVKVFPSKLENYSNKFNDTYYVSPV